MSLSRGSMSRLIPVRTGDPCDCHTLNRPMHRENLKHEAKITLPVHSQSNIFRIPSVGVNEGGRVRGIQGLAAASPLLEGAEWNLRLAWNELLGMRLGQVPCVLLLTLLLPDVSLVHELADNMVWIYVHMYLLYSGTCQ